MAVRERGAERGGRKEGNPLNPSLPVTLKPQQHTPVGNHFIKRWLDADCNKRNLAATHTHMQSK